MSVCKGKDKNEACTAAIHACVLRAFCHCMDPNCWRGKGRMHAEQGRALHRDTLQPTFGLVNPV